IVTPQESGDGRGVIVVLMLCRLLRLRLDEERAGEADAVLVLGDEREEARQLRLLAREIGVEQRLISLAAAPEDVVRTTQAIRQLEHRLDLGRRVREYIWVRIRCRARRIPRMREQVRGAPEEANTGARHVCVDQ